MGVMRDCLFTLILCFNITLLGCSGGEEYQSGPKTLLDEIIKFHLEEAKKNKYTYEEYLELTKPYGMWDVRPRNATGVNIGGRLARSGEVSHYHYGLFCAYFKIPKEDIYQPLENFRSQVYYKEGIYKEAALRYMNRLGSMVMKIVNSNHTTFVSHKMFQRVDDVFFENGEYWKYDIPLNSPYVISDKKILLEDMLFSDEEKEILKELENLRLYGAVYQNNVVFVIIDGLLNYSYGYIFSPLSSELITPGPLFNLIKMEKIHDEVDVYFYLSN